MLWIATSSSHVSNAEHLSSIDIDFKPRFDRTLQCQPTSVITYSHVTVCRIFGCLALPYWYDLLIGLISLLEASIVQRLLSGTHFLGQCLIVFKSRLKTHLFYLAYNDRQ